jgi:hypothetical protein
MKIRGNCRSTLAASAACGFARPETPMTLKIVQNRARLIPMLLAQPRTQSQHKLNPLKFIKPIL